MFPRSQRGRGGYRGGFQNTQYRRTNNPINTNLQWFDNDDDQDYLIQQFLLGRTPTQQQLPIRAPRQIRPTGFGMPISHNPQKRSNINMLMKQTKQNYHNNKNPYHKKEYNGGHYHKQQNQQKKMFVGVPYYELVTQCNGKVTISGSQMNVYKRIKKLFKDIYPKAHQFDLRYSLTHPALYFNSRPNSYLQDTKKILIKDFMIKIWKSKKKMPANQKQLLLDYYKACYKIVPEEYANLMNFAYEKAVQINHKSLTSMLKNKHGKESFTLFFTKNINNKKIQYNFAAVNNDLFEISFQGDEIKDKFSKTNPTDYLVYKRFQEKGGECDDVIPEFADLLQGEEMDSDTQDTYANIKQKIPTFSKMERLRDILEKDLSQLEQRIQEKNDKFNDMRQKSPDSTIEIEKLGDEVEQLTVTLENFLTAKKKVQNDLEGLSKYDENYDKVVTMSLKKMIMAQKQMETRLPILLRKRKIFELLDDKHNNNLIILEGQTGSGKSTQLPQMLCEYYDIFNPDKNVKPVLVTQPRRLATRSLAERVAMQMEEEVRGLVDYMATSGKQVNPDAKIVFKLDRLVLDELAVDPTLSKYSCMVIDEAHERTISIDVILGLVKQLLKKRNDFKIIVTSASMDTELFRKYFNTTIQKVSGRLYPVQTIYKPYNDVEDPVNKIIRLIEQELVSDNGRMVQKYKGHVLTFCSDTGQIQTLCQHFSKTLNPKFFKVYGLHGKLTPEQQKKVFEKSLQYKIIFASRIAQTAITIDGVTVVIDPGEDRELIYDQKNKISTMKLSQISKSSAKQRAGRAGRTKEGFCFRLYTEGYHGSMRANKLPEIMNMALDSLVLRLKSLQIQDIIKFPYISPPKQQALISSIELMKMIGCLDINQKITIIGNLLVRIPIEPFLSRAIFEGLLFQQVQKDDQFWKQQKELKKIPLLSYIIKTLCMIIHSDNIFQSIKNERELCQKIKFENFSHEEGDFFFLRKIYQQFQKLKADDYSKTSNAVRKWAKDHFISLKTLNQVKDLIREIEVILKNSFIDYKLMQEELIKMKAKIKKCSTENQLILACLVSSFCANLCLYSGNQYLGYTLISQNRPLRIYGTSTLALQGINPKWIVCYNLYQNFQMRNFCKVAHAIDMNKLDKIMDNYVYEAFKINQIKQVNPYYEHEIYNESTCIYRSIYFDYLKRQTNQRYPFLKQLNLFFKQDLNRIEIFYNKNCMESQIEHSKKSELLSGLFLEDTFDRNLKKKFENYVNNKRKNFALSYRHNFVGNIYVKLEDGCQVKDIQFFNTENQYQVKFSQDLYDVVAEYFPSFGRVDFLCENNIHMAKVYIAEQNVANTFEQLLNVLKQMENSQIKWQKILVDKRRKVPRAKIFFHFFAGQCNDPKILLNYNSFSKINKTPTMLTYIESALTRSTHKIAEKLRKGYNLVLTKKKTGINCYPKYTVLPSHVNLDEYDILELFYNLKKTNLISYDFEIPNHVTKFRDIDTKISMKSDEAWIAEIQKLLEKAGLNYKENTSIRVWGYNFCNKQQRAKLGIYQKARVSMHAQIQTLNIKALEQLKIKYDGEKNILGTQRLHVISQFQQVIAFPHQRVYDALLESYEIYKQRFKSAYPEIFFEQISKRTRKGNQVLIKIRSRNRQDLLQPTRYISRIFTPKILPLNEAHFKFLNKVRMGKLILDDLEQMYHFKIYFGFQIWNSLLKLYCQDGVQKQVFERLSQQIKKYKYFQSKISYRGKNLNKVKQILEDKLQEINFSSVRNSEYFLQYEICFQKREIQLTADYVNFDIVKNAILELVSEEKEECMICAGIMEKPFCLLNCKHNFCWFCLASTIREARKSTQTLVQCPNFECKAPISVYDIKTILSFQEFQKICDTKISKAIQKKDEFHTCLSPNCEQIFYKQDSQAAGSFQCQLCGKWYCYKCKASHKNYNCDEWKMQQSFSQAKLKQLGIKKCPVCRTGIEKNKGCNHITCVNCNNHICWNCTKVFKTAKEVYDHLANQCGGIFPLGAA